MSQNGRSITLGKVSKGRGEEDFRSKLKMWALLDGLLFMIVVYFRSCNIVT